jgi:iron(III) transport system permease protein
MTEARLLAAKTPTPGVFAFLLPSPWMLAALGIALLVAIPVAVVFSSLAHPDPAIWAHLSEYVLPGLLVNTFWLVLGVGLGVTVLGVSLAWLTAVCEFPGRGVFSWALLLPLALPAYVSAFVAIGLLDFTGPLSTWLREAHGVLWIPPIRSRGGVIAVMSLALYPYVYLLARGAFLGQGRHALEAAQSLGMSRRRAFFVVALPMARPWIAAGLMLALMETLADFGTVAVFNYDTFTTAIYKAWFSMFSLPTASQLASILIALVFVAVLIEQASRARLRYASGRIGAKQPRIVLRGWARWSAFGFASAVFGLAFVVPMTQLAVWSWDAIETDLDARYWGFVWHSLLLSGLAALIVCTLAALLAYAARARPGRRMTLVQRSAVIGYALPGAVLAVGFFIPLAWLDNRLIDALAGLRGADAGPILSGTLLAMLLAYAARFMAVGFGPIESGLHRISRAMEEASRSLGITGPRLFARVHLPMLRGSLFTAVALVFVDTMKEMPITLMTRPFGWDTLAVRVFEMTSEGEWERAALPSLALVLAGLLPVALLVRQTEEDKGSGARG